MSEKDHNTASVASASDTGALPATLVNVQFLRFAAAMLVVFYHSSAHLKSTGVDQGRLFDVFEAIGFAGVDVFFVISGFIMVYTTVGVQGPASAVQFFKRRLARIYSGYWPFYLIAIALFAWVGGPYLANADLFRSFFLWPGQPLISVSWTLTYEMFFYIVFALLIALTAASRERLLWILLACIVAWCVFSQFVRHAYDRGRLEEMSLAEAYMASPYLAEFLGGALLAAWLIRNPSGRSWSLLLIGVALFLAGGWINNTFFSTHIEQGYYIFWRVLVFGLPSLFIMAGVVRLEFRSKVAPLRFSLAAGGASYAIYLSHVLWLTAVQHMGLNRFLSQFPSWVGQLVFILNAGLIVIFCIAHYRVIERPLHHVFRKGLGIS
jgi:peptidoglycan/LPS O-acetylase OafA/YrhL